MPQHLSRRDLGLGLGASLAAGSLPWPAIAAPQPGLKTILVRYGGGVRRREIIDPVHSLSPYFLNRLMSQGTLFKDMRVQSAEGIVTSHAQGTLYMLTGRYDRYKDVEEKFLRERFEPKAPTLFEYLRAARAIAPHEALIVNGENRKDEDFFTYSSDPHYGVRYRSEVLSLNQYKAYLLRQSLARGDLEGEARVKAQAQLADLEAHDMRRADAPKSPELDAFWARWRSEYGESGLNSPRGDRLLTALAIRAMRELSPRLMLINYQDPDYVHWGNASHYSRAIGIIDSGLEALMMAVETLPHYRGQTVFVIVPDCGRDDNRLMALPHQHHFGSRSAHEIFALILGPGIARGRIVDKPVEQIAIAPTIAQVMGFAAPEVDARPLEDAFA